MTEDNKDETPQILTPEEEVRAAESNYMRAHSKYVNTFEPTDALSQAMDAAGKIVNELYLKYPQFKPVPTDKPLP